MGFEEMVVAIIGTVAGVGLFGFIIYQVSSLIKSWINRKKGGYDEKAFNKLAKAFMQYKKDTDRRLQNLEAIISDADEKEIERGSASGGSLSEPDGTIEIEEKEKETEQQSQSNSSQSQLKNMLNN